MLHTLLKIPDSKICPKTDEISPIYDFYPKHVRNNPPFFGLLYSTYHIGMSSKQFEICQLKRGNYFL